VRDVMLLSTRQRVGNQVVVTPSELRCHGRRLMVQSLFARHASLHRSHPWRSFGRSSLPNVRASTAAPHDHAERRRLQALVGRRGRDERRSITRPENTYI
jgi:hypothetical protein